MQCVKTPVWLRNAEELRIQAEKRPNLGRYEWNWNVRQQCTTSCCLLEHSCKDSELPEKKQNPSAALAKSNVCFVLMRRKLFIPAAKSSVVGSTKTSNVLFTSYEDKQGKRGEAIKGFFNLMGGNRFW